MMNNKINEELSDLVGQSFYERDEIKKSFSDIKEVISNGADVNCKTNDDFKIPMISKAIISLRVDLVNLFISKGADTNARCIDKETPLHYLVQNFSNKESLEIIELLLNNGADISLQNHDGKTPLQLLDDGIENLSFYYRSKDVLNKIKTILINAEKEKQSAIANSIILINRIKFDKTSEEEIIDTIRDLTLSGADINYPDGHLNIAINHAVNKKYYKLTEKLIDWGSDVDNCSSNNPAATPFLNAITMTKDPKMVKLLIEKVNPYRFKDRDNSFLLRMVSNSLYDTKKEKQNMVNIINTTKYINPFRTRFNKKKEEIKKSVGNKRIGGFKR